jgi:PAS domain S-box-containing protein
VIHYCLSHLQYVNAKYQSTLCLLRCCRDRNREHAKKSRIRKRVLLDTLQDQLKALRAQNAQLRRVVADRLPGELAARVLLECTTEESTLLAGCSSSGPASSEDEGAPKPSALTVNIASGIMSSKAAKAKSSASSSAGGASSTGKKVLMESDYRLMSSLVTTQQNFVLSDPSLPDNPIVYASDGFCRLSGYRRQDILGRNCRFLQGPGTDQAAVNVIRQGVADRKDVSVCLLNYRADGSPFWNQFFLGALKDAVGNIVNYVGVQCEVNALPIAEMKDRVKKLPLPDA